MSRLLDSDKFATCGEWMWRKKKFDSSACQSHCIIDVLRILHCHQDFAACHIVSCVSECVWVCACHSSLLTLHKSCWSATCQHLCITKELSQRQCCLLLCWPHGKAVHTHTAFNVDVLVCLRCYLFYTLDTVGPLMLFPLAAGLWFGFVSLWCAV